MYHLSAFAATPVSGDLASLLLRFSQPVLQLLLVERFAERVIDTIADALLSLVCLSAERMSALISSVLAQQSNTVVQARLASSFHTLLSSSTHSLERKPKFRFRVLVREFLQSVRGLLSMR